MSIDSKHYTNVNYMGTWYRVPVTGQYHHLGAHLEIVPDDDHAMAYLMQDGNLAVPCGRYGSDTIECAKVAMALAKIMQYHNGEEITYHDLDSDMGLVVNSSDDIAGLFRDYGELVGVNPDDFYGMDDDDENDDESEDN